VEEGHEVEPGVSIIHTPGHSVGSICVAVQQEGTTSLVTGDVLHYSNVALTRRNPMVFWSEQQATESIDRIVAMADGIIYPGHDRPFRMVDGEIEYLRPFELTISGVDPDDPGFGFVSEPLPPFVMPGIEEQSL
jgi:glyoxylase-like metal-dependent hydrolase (beta-lactamase superfamily II)